MTEPVAIAPSRAFDVEKTDPTVRHAFQRLAQDESFVAKRTLREQVLYAQAFFDEEFSTLGISHVELCRFLGTLKDAVVGDIVRRGDNNHAKKGRIPTLTKDEPNAVKGRSTFPSKCKTQ